MKIINQILIAALLSSTLATQALAAKFVYSAAPVTEAAAPAVIPPATSAPPRLIIAASPVAPPTVVQPAPAAPPRASSPASSNSGTYLGAQLGDSTIGALLGYQISKMYAMEISYDYVDPVRTPTTLLEVSRVGISGQALFPIKFSEMGPMAIFIKVGYARTTEKYTVNDPGLGIPAFPATSTLTTTLKTGVTGGAGVQVDLSNNTTARVGGNYVGGDRSVYLAAIYKF